MVLYYIVAVLHDIFYGAVFYGALLYSAALYSDVWCCIV